MSKHEVDRKSSQARRLRHKFRLLGPLKIFCCDFFLDVIYEPEKLTAKTRRQSKSSWSGALTAPGKNGNIVNLLRAQFFFSSRRKFSKEI